MSRGEGTKESEKRPRVKVRKYTFDEFVRKRGSRYRARIKREINKFY